MLKPPQQRTVESASSHQGSSGAPLAHSPLGARLAQATPVRALQTKASLLNAATGGEAPVQRKLFIGKKQVSPEDVDANVDWHVDPDRRATLKAFAADKVDTPERRFATWNRAIYPPEPGIEMESLPDFVSADGYFRLFLALVPGKINLTGGARGAKPDIEGSIVYILDDKGMFLKSFEAQPPRLGIGAILLRELAKIALANRIAQIDVGMPAWTAMGAYQQFGGKPKNAEIHASQVDKFKDPQKQEQFIAQEQQEGEKAKVEAARFWARHPQAPGRPAPGGAAVGAKPPITDDDRARATNLMAMSGQLVFDSAPLLQAAAGKMQGKWIGP